MEIELANGFKTIVDEEDAHLARAFTWYARTETSGKVYAVCNRKVRGVPGTCYTVRLHRLIIGAKEGELVDHINGDTLDNRRSNLRICTNSQNQANSKGRGAKSGFKNVSWNKRKRKWCGIFMHQRKAIFVGYFSDPAEAARAVDAKVREVRGEFARLNFPDAA